MGLWDNVKNSVTSVISGIGGRLPNWKVGVALAATLGIGGVSLAGLNASNIARFSDANVDCADEYREATTQASYSAVDENAAGEKQLEMAKLIYSVLKTYNSSISDEQVAVCLSNWQAESGIDPTTIEGIYSEPFQIGPRKQQALTDLSAYTRGPLRSMYSGGVNWSAYVGSDGKSYCGIGIVQWTGGGAQRIIEAAESTGNDWYDSKFQLAYMLAVGSPCGGGGGKDFWAQYATNCPATKDGCRWFMKHYEGISTEKAYQTHEANYDFWLSQMGSWSVNAADANDIISMAQNMGASAAAKKEIAAANECAKCASSLSGGNSSIAEAAATYAYPTKDEGRNNNGTELFQAVHDAVYPGDSFYMSCDRGVACAVKWAGADDDYPKGDTNAQLVYLRASPKWQEIGNTGTMQASDFQPGDVLCLNGHTLLYTGHDILEEVHHGAEAANADSVSASFGQRSPGCGSDTTDILKNNGQDPLGRGVYYVFRNVKPDNSDKYKHVVDGYNFQTSSGGVATQSACVDNKDQSEGALDESEATGDAAKIVEAAKNTSSPGAGFCAQWVSQVFSRAGFGYPGGNACDMYDDWCKSSDKSELKPGMIIAVDTHNLTRAGRRFGHVGIYIGGGQVMDNVGSIRTVNVNTWIDTYSGVHQVKWGWVNGRALM